MKVGHETQESKAKGHILPGFERHLEARGIRCRRGKLSAIREFLAWCDSEDKDFFCLTEAEAEGFILSLLDRDPVPARGTVNNKLAALKGFYLYLLKNGFVLHHPFYQVKSLSVGRQLPRNILKPADMDILLTRFPELYPGDLMLKTLMEILYGSGIRISEAESIKLSDLELAVPRALIKDHKTGKVRMVPLTSAAARMIARYRTEVRETLLSSDDLSAGFLFPQGGKTTLGCRLNRRLKHECTRLGLKILTSHSFRHSCVTHLLSAGAGIRLVQAYLGHESIHSTQRYTHVDKEDLKSVIAAFHPREVSGS